MKKTRKIMKKAEKWGKNARGKNGGKNRDKNLEKLGKLRF